MTWMLFLAAAARWRAGDLAAEVRTDYDYDGMAKFALSLSAPGRAVDEVTLVAPLRGSLARVLHACGDGLRHNYAGAVPAGEGVVWDSRKANKLNIVGAFYPYVYVGGPARGLCWFADTDRGFSLDDHKPAIELVRRGTTLELRVHFINQPTRLDRPRRIVFGLQAAPAKPMPRRPKNWRLWRCNKNLPGCFRFTILGSTFYWGGLSYDLYPRGRDFSMYEWIRDAREKGRADRAFIARWLSGYDAPRGSKLWEKYKAHIWYTARVAPLYPRREGAALIPYTNARGHGFQSAEWPAFQDEWIRFPYYNRSRKGGVGYDIVPTESFRDCAVWYYKKAMTCFDGVYWDNTYLHADFDTVAGGAWKDERGRIHPSLGLWNLRALIRRTAVMYYEQGKRGVFVAHMTNTDILPILSFANVNLDWEWRYGDRDFQDRFPADLTVAETIGRKAGNVPLILSGGFRNRKAPRYPWVMRTRLGVCLVHELRVWDHGPKETVEFLRKLHAFGYGRPDCRVFNYWDEGFPVAARGVDARAIAMSRAGKALVVVTDYGEGGNAVVRVDAAKLGVSPQARAADFETGRPIPGDAARGFSFRLKKHDFKALLIE